jgi:hypothetical protein
MRLRCAPAELIGISRTESIWVWNPEIRDA